MLKATKDKDRVGNAAGLMIYKSMGFERIFCGPCYDRSKKDIMILPDVEEGACYYRCPECSKLWYILWEYSKPYDCMVPVPKWPNREKTKK